MAGILDYRNYLNTLQTLTNVDHIFPSDQKTYTYSVDNSGTGGWVANITWQTLLIDQVSYDSTGRPNFSNSTLLGYFENSSGTTTEYSTGTISVPEGIYTGPLLPASDLYVPIIIIGFEWRQDGASYQQNIGYIVNWEPGVPIGNPYDSEFFEPFIIKPSVLTLTGPDLIIYKDDATLTAISDIPLDLTGVICRFFASTGTVYNELGSTTFIENRADLNFNSENVLTTGTYTIFASFGGKRDYSRATSNIINLEVIEGIPLIKDFSSFDPDLEMYFPSTTVDYTLGVIPSPLFPPSGVPIGNTATIRTIDGFPPLVENVFKSGNFVNGVIDGTFTVTNSMVDTGLTSTATNFTITGWTANTTTYTATIFVTNTETVQTRWLSQRVGKYASGRISDTINVGTSTSRTLAINPFPLLLDVSPEGTVWQEPINVSVGTVSTPYGSDIRVVATNTDNTVIIFEDNASGTDTINFSYSALSTGTWTITASYPGDFGQSIYYANTASTSNSIIHRVRPGNELPAVFTFWSTATETLNVWASTSSVLVNDVSFFDGTTFLGTASWNRLEFSEITTQTVWYQGGTLKVGSLSRNFDQQVTSRSFGGPNERGWAASTGSNVDSLLNNGYPSAKNPNFLRLFKYYDGTNYDISAVTGTNVDAIADPIKLGVDWNFFKIRDLTVAEKQDLRFSFVNPTFTTVGIYDAYRVDEIGDYRGYNVIGIDASSAIDKPLLPMTLKFQAPKTNNTWPYGQMSGKPREIDLVEYIGEVTWTKPIENINQQNGTQARSTITVWLYRFTPEVRQTNTVFENQFPITTAQSFIPRPVRAADPSIPYYQEYSMPVFSGFTNSFGEVIYGYGSKDITRFSEYGRKVWITRNPSDPGENDYTAFCNEWNYVFGQNYFKDNFGNIVEASRSTSTVDTITTATVIQAASVTNTWTATLNLPLNTVSTVTNLIARWPGTIGLDAIHGRFLPFELTVDTNPTRVEVTSFDVSPISSNTGTFVNTQHATNPTSTLYITNPIMLRAEVTTDEYQYPLPITGGTVEFFVPTSGKLVATTSTVNGVAQAIITGTDITSSLGVNNIGVRARFSSPQFIGTQTSLPKQIQVVRPSGNVYPINFYITGGRPDLNPGRPGYEYLKVMDINKAGTGLTSGPVNINGTVSLQLPFFNRRFPYFYMEPRHYTLFRDKGYMIFNLYYTLNNDDNYKPLKVYRDDLLPYPWQELAASQREILFTTLEQPNEGLKTPYAFNLNINTNVGGASYFDPSIGSSNLPMLRYETTDWSSVQLFVYMWGQTEREFISLIPFGPPATIVGPTYAYAAIPQGSQFGWSSNLNIGI